MPNTKVKWDYNAINGIKKRFMQGMVKMGYAMSNQAKLNAPVLSGALRNSIRVTPDEGQSNVTIKAGGVVGRFNVPYARRREFENPKNPSTRYYMTRAFNKVVQGDIKQYFKELTK